MFRDHSPPSAAPGGNARRRARTLRLLSLLPLLCGVCGTGLPTLRRPRLSALRRLRSAPLSGVLGGDMGRDDGAGGEWVRSGGGRGGRLPRFALHLPRKERSGRRRGGAGVRFVSTVQEGVAEMFGELRIATDELRESIAALRQEIEEMQRTQRELVRERPAAVAPPVEEAVTVQPIYHPRQAEFDAISEDVIRWAEKMLSESEEDGWRPVQCMKALRKKYNRAGSIECWLKWMPDSRSAAAAEADGGRLHPCIRVVATIDAPFDAVCAYLARADNLGDYNDLVVDHRDLELISPHSKITWGAIPQILFVKARDFVTFCHFRWVGEGGQTQLVINQAVEHDDKPGNNEEGDGRTCRAHAIRGANYIKQDPHDPTKTKFSLLAHGNVGGNIPTWASKTAVNTVAPIEPFKLMHNIETGALACAQALQEEEQQEPVSHRPHKKRPSGLSQLGYACFWPDGEGGWNGGTPPSEAETVEQPLPSKATGTADHVDLPPVVLPPVSPAPPPVSLPVPPPVALPVPPPVALPVPPPMPLPEARTEPGVPLPSREPYVPGTDTVHPERPHGGYGGAPPPFDHVESVAAPTRTSSSVARRAAALAARARPVARRGDACRGR